MFVGLETVLFSVTPRNLAHIFKSYAALNSLKLSHNNILLSTILRNRKKISHLWPLMELLGSQTAHRQHWNCHCQCMTGTRTLDRNCNCRVPVHHSQNLTQILLALLYEHPKQLKCEVLNNYHCWQAICKFWELESLRQMSW